MTTNINTPKLIESCDLLASRIVMIGGEHHGSSFIFNQCMRLFDNKRLPAEAVTFSVFINAPVMKPGEATIYRDGRLEMHTI